MLNHIVLMGRLTRDPELRYSDYTKVAVTTFTLAVERDYKESSGERKTDFIDIVAFRNTAEFAAKYFGKGQLTCVSGRLQVSSYTVENDGSKRRYTNVVADSIYFAGSKKADTAQQTPPAQTFTELDSDTDDDFPF